MSDVLSPELVERTEDQPPDATSAASAPPTSAPPAARRSPGRIVATSVAIFVALAGVCLTCMGTSKLSDASRTAKRTAGVERESDAAAKARDAAVAASDVARQKAGVIDATKVDLDGRLKRLSATVQDAVRSSNRVLDDCVSPFTGNLISRLQALDCLPDRIADLQGAVDAEKQATADVRTTLTAMEGAVNA